MDDTSNTVKRQIVLDDKQRDMIREAKNLLKIDAVRDQLHEFDFQNQPEQKRM